jgi:hypothetical protein
MKKIIHKLRERPEKEKRHLLHISTFFFAVILVFFWSFSLGKGLTGPKVKEDIKQDLEPFKVLKDNILSGAENISPEFNIDEKNIQ